MNHLFPTTKTWAFFDHAAVAPPCAPARDALIEWANDLSINGALTEQHWLQRIRTARELAGRLINANPDDVAFVKNTSEGIGIVAEGFPWKPGDNVVTAAEEYPANLYPWMNLASRGVELRRVSSRGNRIHIDDVRDAMDDRTRILTISFVEFASGLRNNLDALGQLCREKNIFFFVDAIQGLGVLPLDVQRTPIDFLAADGHKWLLAPEGAGVLYMRPGIVDTLHPIGVGWNSVVGARDFSNIDFALKPHAGRYESGTLNTGGIAALGAALQLILDEGVASIQDRIYALTNAICIQAERLGLTVFSSREGSDWSGIVSLNVPGDLRAIVRRCRDSGVVVNQRAGRLRLSPHFYNTMEEVERFAKALR